MLGEAAPSVIIQFAGEETEAPTTGFLKALPYLLRKDKKRIRKSLILLMNIEVLGDKIYPI